jgi:glycosyltransferase involved in cell wall biosynthesis
MTYKILIILIPSYNPNIGGVQRITYNLGKYFTHKGHTVSYFSFKSTGHIKAEYGKLFHPNKNSSVSASIPLLENSIKEIQPDVIINQMPYEKPITKFLSTLDRKKIQLFGCIHNSLFSFKSNVSYKVRESLPKPIGSILANDPFKKLPLVYHRIKHRKDLKHILKSHETLILYTPPNFEELKYFIPEKELKGYNIDFMPNPVSEICEVLPKKDKTIIHVGRINSMQKRSDLLLDFWEKVHKQLPDWKFQILGDGPYMSTLKKDLKDRSLPNVELLGFQKPEKYFKKAAIFMMPSAYEGFPNTIIEAFSSGCPVIAFDSYMALSWIVQNGKNGYLAKPFDTKDMANYCINLAKDDKRLLNMQKNALHSANKFSLEKIGEKWLNLFKSKLT